MTEWPKVEVVVSPDAAEDIGAELLDAGATGIEQVDGVDGAVRLVAYFPADADLDSVRRFLEHRDQVLSVPELGSLPDDDWLRIWKRGFEPTPIGKRLLILPSWKRDRAADYPGRICIEIDPGMAFGTGTHETTRLCLEWIDAHWTGGTLLDVGTGTGILAMAAKLLEPSSNVVAIDIDPVAVDVARENTEANDVRAVRLEVGGPADLSGTYNVVIANITADAICTVRDALLERTDETLLLSGVLNTQREQIEEAFVGSGLTMHWLREDGEWCAMAWRRD